MWKACTTVSCLETATSAHPAKQKAGGSMPVKLLDRRGWPSMALTAFNRQDPRPAKCDTGTETDARNRASGERIAPAPDCIEFDQVRRPIVPFANSRTLHVLGVGPESISARVPSGKTVTTFSRD